MEGLDGSGFFEPGRCGRGVYRNEAGLVGTSENAVKTQIWTALIAMLVLKFLQLKSSWNWSQSYLAAMLRFNLLTYRRCLNLNINSQGLALQLPR